MNVVQMGEVQGVVLYGGALLAVSALSTNPRRVLVYCARVQYFFFADLNPMPLCNDMGTGSGVVSISFWMPSMVSAVRT